MRREKSASLYERAVNAIPGGVNSPVRAFKAVGGSPPFIDRGEGAYLTDVDGNKYLDLVGSWGSLIFGHSHPRIQEAISRQLNKGATFGAPTELEVEFAETIRRFVPSCQKIRLVSSGTEACMSAVRLARGFTGRAKVIKFEGCYHGHADFLLAKSGSGIATLGIPDSAGVPPDLTSDTLTLPYNDLTAVEAILAMEESRIASVIVEPVAGNMGCVLPEPGFLEGLRAVTQREGALLIFDEVMTGFRLARGGAQERFGIEPDLTAHGKIVGGGLPLAAYGGRADIMDSVAPVGPVYQAGTLSGNPLAVAAGLEALKMIDDDPEIYTRLDRLGDRLAVGLRAAAESEETPVRVNQIGSMFTLFFSGSEVCNYESARSADTVRFGRYFHRMLESGTYLPPSQFEAAFLSTAMTDSDIDLIIVNAAAALRGIRDQ